MILLCFLRNSFKWKHVHWYISIDRWYIVEKRKWLKMFRSKWIFWWKVEIWPLDICPQIFSKHTSIHDTLVQMPHKIFCNDWYVLKCAINAVATNHIWPLSTWNMASENEELNFKFYLILSIKFKFKQLHVVSSYHTGQERSRGLEWISYRSRLIWNKENLFLFLRELRNGVQLCRSKSWELEGNVRRFGGKL